MTGYRPPQPPPLLYILSAQTLQLHLLVKAQVPISIFFAGLEGEMSKSKMSIGNPSVVQALGIYP